MFRKNTPDDSNADPNDPLDFALGLMTPEEEAAFRLRMADDLALQREVGKWRKLLLAARDWALAVAPGEEKLSAADMEALLARKVGATHRVARQGRFASFLASVASLLFPAYLRAKLRTGIYWGVTLSLIAVLIWMIWKSRNPSSTTPDPSYAHETQVDELMGKPHISPY